MVDNQQEHPHVFVALHNKKAKGKFLCDLASHILIKFDVWIVILKYADDIAKRSPIHKCNLCRGLRWLQFQYVQQSTWTSLDLA